MSQNPPASGGWIDPYGTSQPGVPPPGYWQASDGRWYPPESRPAEPFTPPGEMTVAAVPPAGPGPTGQPYGTPSPGDPGFTPPSSSGYGPPPGAPGAQGFGPPPGAPGFGAPGFGPPTGYGPSPGPGYGPPPGAPGFGSTPGSPGAPGFGPPGASQPSPYGPVQFGGPGSAPQPPGQKSRTGLWLVLGVVVLAFLGCGTLVLYAIQQGDQEASDITTPTTAIGASSLGAGTTSSTTDDLGSIFGGTDDGLADVVGCTRLDDERLQVELVNNSASQADYGLTIVLEDTPGQRLSDTVAFIEDLRPGERTIEDVFVFETAGASCAVTSADRYTAEVDQAATADVGACLVGDADSFGDVSASVTVTNSAAANNDYAITVAILGADGVRHGTGFASVETVRPGETAPSDVFTTIDYAAGYTCEVVLVDRYAS